MAFEQGNTIWKDSHKSRESNKDKLGEFFDIVACGGIEEYANKLDRLGKKDAEATEKLTKDEREFMDRFEKLFQYVKPKKTDVTSDGKELQPLLVKFIDAD